MTIEDFYSLLASFISVKLLPPVTFSEQIKASRNILQNDITGLISPIISLAIKIAGGCKIKIETNNTNLTKILNKTLKDVNNSWLGKIPIGFDAVKKDFFRDCWESGANFVRVNWNKKNDLLLPEQIFLKNPASIEVKGDDNTLGDFKCYQNNKEITETKSSSLFVYKDAATYQKYPIPPLISRGTYVNYEIIKAIKSLQQDYIKATVGGLWTIFKGNQTRSDLKYTEIDFQKIKTDFEAKLKEVKNQTELEKLIPILVGGFDTNIELKSPDLVKVFDGAIFTQLNKEILFGLGWVAVLEGLSTRRDITLNPKPYISAVIDTVDTLKQFLNDLIYTIADKNKNHLKYFNRFEYKIIISPIIDFWSDDLKSLIRLLSDRGLLSIESTLDTFGYDFEVELERREKEAEKGHEIDFYPRILMNTEQAQTAEEMAKSPLRKEIPEEQETEEDKTNPVDKLEYTMSELILHSSPYKSLNDLPSRLKKALDNLDSQLQHVWFRAFNNAWYYYNEIDPDTADERASKVAWSMIKKMGKRTKDGWVIKAKYKKSETKFHKSEKIEDEEEKRLKKILTAGKLKLLDKLLGGDK